MSMQHVVRLHDSKSIALIEAERLDVCSLRSNPQFLDAFSPVLDEGVDEGRTYSAPLLLRRHADKIDDCHRTLLHFRLDNRKKPGDLSVDLAGIQRRAALFLQVVLDPAALDQIGNVRRDLRIQVETGP